MSEYITFALEAEKGKTAVFTVRATRDSALLGIIKWFGRWRQYAFFPEPGTIFNPDCLNAISEHVAWLTREHRGRRAS